MWATSRGWWWLRGPQIPRSGHRVTVVNSGGRLDATNHAEMLDFRHEWRSIEGR